MVRSPNTKIILSPLCRICVKPDKIDKKIGNTNTKKNTKHKTHTQNTKKNYVCKYITHTRILSDLCRRGGARCCKSSTRQNHKQGKHKHKTQKNCHLCAGEVEPGGAGVARDRGQRTADVVQAGAARVVPSCLCMQLDYASE